MLEVVLGGVQASKTKYASFIVSKCMKAQSSVSICYLVNPQHSICDTDLFRPRPS